ncbi:hypothetical protein PENTCL1PPCAC_8498, partial [Pristionchus entomophagus]
IRVPCSPLDQSPRLLSLLLLPSLARRIPYPRPQLQYPVPEPTATEAPTSFEKWQDDHSVAWLCNPLGLVFLLLIACFLYCECWDEWSPLRRCCSRCCSKIRRPTKPPECTGPFAKQPGSAPGKPSTSSNPPSSGAAGGANLSPAAAAIAATQADAAANGTNECTPPNAAYRTTARRAHERRPAGSGDRGRPGEGAQGRRDGR